MATVSAALDRRASIQRIGQNGLQPRAAGPAPRAGRRGPRSGPGAGHHRVADFARKALSWLTMITVRTFSAAARISRSNSTTRSGSRSVEQHHPGVHRQVPGDCHPRLTSPESVSTASATSVPRAPTTSLSSQAQRYAARRHHGQQTADAAALELRRVALPSRRATSRPPGTRPGATRAAARFLPRCSTNSASNGPAALQSGRPETGAGASVRPKLRRPSASRPFVSTRAASCNSTVGQRASLRSDCSNASS